MPGVEHQPDTPEQTTDEGDSAVSSPRSGSSADGHAEDDLMGPKPPSPGMTPTRESPTSNDETGPQNSDRPGTATYLLHAEVRPVPNTVDPLDLTCPIVPEMESGVGISIPSTMFGWSSTVNVSNEDSLREADPVELSEATRRSTPPSWMRYQPANMIIETDGLPSDDISIFIHLPEDEAEDEL